jgi:hypothetical protein
MRRLILTCRFRDIRPVTSELDQRRLGGGQAPLESPAGYPADMATMEELERRVEQLEEQFRHAFPAKIDAVAYGVSLVHEDLRGFREETRATLSQHGELLQEILHRLPAAPG